MQVDQRVFKDLMSEKLPRLHAHFERYKVDFSLITFNWFLVVFVDSVVSDILFKIWDAFLYEGPKVRGGGNAKQHRLILVSTCSQISEEKMKNDDETSEKCSERHSVSWVKICLPVQMVCLISLLFGGEASSHKNVLWFAIWTHCPSNLFSPELVPKLLQVSDEAKFDLSKS